MCPLSVWLLLHSIVSVHFIHVVTDIAIADFFKKFFLSFFFGCTGSSLLCGLFSLVVSGGLLSSCLLRVASYRARAGGCAGFSSCGLGPESTRSAVVAIGFVAPGHAWGLLWTRIELVSAALAGEFCCLDIWFASLLALIDVHLYVFGAIY